MIILDQHVEDTSSDLSHYLRSQLHAVSTSRTVTWHSDDIAEAVVSFCETHHRGNSLSFRYVSLLTSRVLLHVGDPRAALRLLEKEFDDGCIARACVDIVAREKCSPVFMMCVASGLLRPARLDTIGEEATWVLDLRHAGFSPTNSTELHVMAMLGRFVQVAAELWNDRRGRGWLGVGGIRESGIRIAPGELIHSIESCLAAEQARRDWVTWPRVLDVGD